jgi:hypothetical protein
MTSSARPNVRPVQRGVPAAPILTDPGGLVVAGPMTNHVARSVSLLTPGDVGCLLETAGRAPSVHNTQPWKFRILGNTVELLADPARWLHHQDPAGRELMISCGAALFGLRLAFRKLGFVPRTELLPDPLRPSLAARIEPVGFASLTRQEAELLAAVAHRHTHRGAFAPGAVAPRLLAAMCDDAAAEGCRLVLIDDDQQVAALAEQVRRATDQQSGAEVRAELRQWVLPAGSDRKDGVPAAARIRPGWQPGERGRLPQRDFGLAGIELADGMAESARAVLATAVLITADDTVADWLRAGQALDRLLVHAATRWVFASLQSLPLEVPRCRAEVRCRLGLAGYPQMILQFGRANTAAATPRRSQAELTTE